jgi:photosystem II stability/assembly factor-like uncharacterized protein
MKNFTIFIIILFNLSALNLEAQNLPKLVDMSGKISIAGINGNLSDVQKVGNTLWISCSSSAVIFRSIDGGNTFTSPATASVTQAIYMFPDATNGWAVGLSKGNKTTDGGQSWIIPSTTIGGTIYDVYFPTSSVGYTVGNSGAIYKVEDGGTIWIKKTVPLNASVLSVVFPSSAEPNNGYIALANAITTIYKTTNGGDTWNYMTLPGITSSMSCLEFIDVNTGWAAGGNGEIFSYKNGIWTKQSSPVTTSLNGISFGSDGLNGWAVGDRGVILHTTNGGTTWTQEGIGITTQNLTKVDVVSSIEAYIVGYGKTFIKYTTDYGLGNTAQWSNISAKLSGVPATSNLADVHFINANEGVISSGNTSEVYVTTNGGNSFITRTVPNTDFLNSIQMLSASEFYGGSQLGRIYKSTNSGANLTSLGTTGTQMRSITFPPASATGYSCGDNGKSFQITSTGITNLPTGVTTTNLKSVSFPTAIEGWLCGGAIIRHFFNGTWYGDQTYPTNGYNGICFVNNTSGWAVGDNGVIIHTTDGKNWFPQINPDTQSPKSTLNDVFFLNVNEGWAVGDRGLILHTTNGGTIWFIEGNGLTNSLLTSVYFTSPTNGFVTGTERTLLKFSTDGAATRIDPDIVKADGFEVFPNPGNGRFNLKVPVGQQVYFISVVNSSGQTVQNVDISGQDSEFTFDLSDQLNGIYLTRCSTNKGQVCRKIVKR